MHPPGRAQSVQHPREPAPLAPKVPTANEDRLAVADILGTTIKLTSSATWRRPLAWRQRATASGAGAVSLYRRPAAVTGFEIRCTPSPGTGWRTGFPGCSQPGAGRLATQCARAPGSRALAAAAHAATRA